MRGAEACFSHFAHSTSHQHSSTQKYFEYVSNNVIAMQKRETELRLSIVPTVVLNTDGSIATWWTPGKVRNKAMLGTPCTMPRLCV